MLRLPAGFPAMLAALALAVPAAPGLAQRAERHHAPGQHAAAKPAQPPLAEWGSMIGGDRNLLFSAPHVVLFPGIAITLTVLAFNLIGDGLRDALDPRLQR